MSEIPQNFKYSKTHEWIHQSDDGEITVGITEHAQDLLGDMVFVELPEPGESITAGEEVGVLESVKAAADLYAPLSGKVMESNPKLADAPHLVNSDPYGEGWLFKLQVGEQNIGEQLLNAAQYEAFISEEE